MKTAILACAIAALAAPSLARAEPINIGVVSTTGTGGVDLEGAGASWFNINVGEVSLGQPGDSVVLSFDGLKAGSDYSVDIFMGGERFSPWNTLRAEILDPAGDGDDARDAGDGSGLPSGYTNSNNLDGFSFAQGSSLERSAVTFSGDAVVTADENSHRGDILLFSGLTTPQGAFHLRFGLRDRIGGREFLVRLSAEGGPGGGGSDNLPTPEPASMLLLGTGLAGIAAARRRRRATQTS